MPAGEVTIRIDFPELSTAKANRAAAELGANINDVGQRLVQVETVRDDPETQDFGSTLIVVLGTPAVVVVARAIYNYVAKRGDRVVIRTAGGEVIATGSAAANIDVAATVAALQSKIDVNS